VADLGGIVVSPVLGVDAVVGGVVDGVADGVVGGFACGGLVSAGFESAGFGGLVTVHLNPFVVFVQTSSLEPEPDLALTFLQLAPAFGPAAAEAGDTRPSMIATPDSETTLAAIVTRRVSFMAVKPPDLTAAFRGPIPPAISSVDVLRLAWDVWLATLDKGNERLLRL
jgi:hypothetical protein